MMNEKIDLSEIKIYPGSPKGPNPEDDPEFYSKWFVENQPKKILGKYIKQMNFRELGVKTKYI